MAGHEIREGKEGIVTDGEDAFQVQELTPTCHSPVSGNRFLQVELLKLDTHFRWHDNNNQFLENFRKLGTLVNPA